jgi:hypothetical protein
MTRRQRHQNIIENFGGLDGHSPRFHAQSVIGKLGLKAFSDEAIEMLARDLVSSHARQNRYNAEYRALLASRGR